MRINASAVIDRLFLTRAQNSMIKLVSKERVEIGTDVTMILENKSPYKTYSEI